MPHLGPAPVRCALGLSRPRSDPWSGAAGPRRGGRAWGAVSVRRRTVAAEGRSRAPPRQPQGAGGTGGGQGAAVGRASGTRRSPLCRSRHPLRGRPAVGRPAPPAGPPRQRPSCV